MNKKKLRAITIVTVSLILVAILVYPINFYFINKGGISENSADWGNFGNYITGILSPLLAGLNIYLFYILTKTASEFNKQSIEKQLSYNTCKEYQNKINDLVFEFLEILERNKIKNNEQNILIATSCLNRLIFCIDSFVIETEPFINDNNTVKTSKDKLKNSINNLINCRYSNATSMKDFFDEKSEFIKLIFDLVIKNDYGTR